MEHIPLDQFLKRGAFILGISLVTAATSLSIVDGVILVLGGYVLYRSFQRSTFTWKRTPLEHLAILLFLVFVILSRMYLPLDERAFGFITLYSIGVFFIAYYLRQNGLRDMFLRGYMIGATVASLLGILTIFLLKDTMLWEIFVLDGRLRLLFSDPNVFGAFLVPALILSFSRFFDNATASERDSALHYITFLLILGAVLLTDSRGAYLAAILAFLIFLFLERRNLKRIKRHAVMVALLIVMLPTIYLVGSNKTDIFTSRMGSSIIPRFENFSVAREIIGERDVRTLLIGTGNGSYEKLSKEGISAHNTFLRLLIENGLTGLLIFLSFISLVVYKFFRSKRDITMHVLAASIVGMLLHSMIIDTLHWRHFWLILGML